MSRSVILQWTKRNFRRIRLTFTLTTLTAVPFGYILGTGPYNKEVFERRYKVTAALPDHLNKIVNEEYAYFLAAEDRLSSSKKVTFYISNTEDNLDSVSQGALNSPFGARIGLPFYTRFLTYDEAYEYCKKHLEPMMFQGEIACVLWESSVGRQLIETFVLSEPAQRFLIQRDMNAAESGKTITLFPFYWCCYTGVALVLARMLSYYYYASAVAVYIGLGSLLCTPAWWGSRQNAKLDWYASDQAADLASARTSIEHGAGGREYYQKMLKRNRLLREVIPHGDKKISPVGDLKKAITSIWLRYSSLVDIDAENKMIAEISAAGDAR